MVAFAFAIFVSAFLLFQVQPVIGRFILPWYGGSPAVWSSCMLFFQVALLAGYGYAHLLATHFPARRQVLIHLVLLAISLLWLPITPGEGLSPGGAQVPIWGILRLLTLSVGFPYLMLSASGPLLQSWFAKVHPGRSPYRLYALSNLGSLLGLLTYPFLIEPRVGIRMQTVHWSWGYALYGLAAGLCGVLLWRLRPTRS
ncbi:MAG: ferrichrome ABC transporter permease, partial [Verrucomicrobiales bacterium]